MGNLKVGMKRIREYLILEFFWFVRDNLFLIWYNEIINKNGLK